MSTLEWESFLRLLVAFLVGGLIGYEREAHGRPAGLRTHILVCLGAASIMVVFSQLLGHGFSGASDLIKMDPARAAAGIITGVGFLGAGTIMKGNDVVKGLTTAATIWVVAALGIIVGLGNYVVTGVVAVLVLFSLSVLDRIRFPVDRYHSLRIEGEGGETVFRFLKKLLSEKGFSIKDSGMEITSGGKGTYFFTIKVRSAQATQPIVKDIFDIEGIEKVLWN